MYAPCMYHALQNVLAKDIVDFGNYLPARGRSSTGNCSLAKAYKTYCSFYPARVHVVVGLHNIVPARDVWAIFQLAKLKLWY